jgi:hypothetical protein
MKRLYGAIIDAAIKAEVPGMEIGTQHKYALNILLDCGAVFGFPLAGLLSEPIKMIQSPRVTAVLYEVDNLHRQIFTDGRALPKEFDYPAYLGYSVGHWDRERPFTIKVPHDLLADSDLFEMFCNENEKDAAHMGKKRRAMTQLPNQGASPCP